MCFVREFVPQWTVATIARVLYNAPYRPARMTMAVLDGSGIPSQRDLVVLNAALRIKAAARAPDLTSALDAARAALESGEAMRRLDKWRRVAR